jgi:hypothetical protein
MIDKNRIVQVSDRRLTYPDRTVHDDMANKAVCISMSHVYYAASYTGLAYIGPERIDNRTDYWLLDHLGSITRYGEASVEKICRSLGNDAARALSRLRGNYKPLEVVLAGYERNNIAFRAVVSNMRVSKTGTLETLDRFRSDVRRFYPWSPKPEMYTAGATAVFEAEDSTSKLLKTNRGKMVQYLKANREKLTEERVAQLLVWLTRATRTHPTYGYLIGQNCLSVVAYPKTPNRKSGIVQTVEYPAKRNKNSLFMSFYHPVAASPVHHAPHYADWHMDYMNVEMDSDPELPEDTPEDNRPIKDKLGTSLASRMRIKIHNLPEGPNDEG